MTVYMEKKLFHMTALLIIFIFAVFSTPAIRKYGNLEILLILCILGTEGMIHLYNWLNVYRNKCIMVILL